MLVRADCGGGQDGELRHMSDSMYPHKCVQCGAAAYIGGDNLCRCTNEDCMHMDKDLDIGSLELDWENDDTLPQFDFSSVVIKWPV